MSNKIFLNNSTLRKEFIAFLSECLYERRILQIQNVLEKRTRYIAVVLEDIFQSQNASAVLRTSDCLGIQDIHIIENNNAFHVNPKVVMGASKWLSLKKYNGSENNTLKAIEHLKSNGYRIVATTPHSNDVSLENFDLSKGKFALFFGTEYTGLSKSVLDNADEFIRIPMYGFTESYNISVSAAIILYTLISKLRESEIKYELSSDERELLLLSWLEATSKNWHMMEKRFLAEYNGQLQKNTCQSI